MNKKELWLNLLAYQFDDLVPPHLWEAILEKLGVHDAPMKAFADKLSRKLGWQKTFALRAMAEYKKFVYLGVISDAGVTPSKIIDQVWHEHLLFTRGYIKLCEKVIAYQFYHHPELVPLESQTEAFQQQYLDTIALYKKEFGKEPPEDIWDTTKFKSDPAMKEKLETQTVYVATSAGDGGSDAPLNSMFADDRYFDFEGGAFSGGGASGTWEYEDSGDTTDSSDSSDSDSGSSDSGTSCSSSCGGGD